MSDRMRMMLLIFTVLAALLIGYQAGYRARISQEEVFVYPRPMHPPIPEDLGTVWP